MTHTTPTFVFLGILAFVVGAEHLYLFSRLSRDLNLSVAARAGVGLAIAALGLTVLAALLARRFFGVLNPGLVNWLAFSWIGLAFVLTVVFLARDALGAAIEAAFWRGAYDPARRLFFRKALGLAALGTAAGLSGYAFWNAARPVGVKRLSIPLARWPKALDGLRVVQLTDMHISSMVSGAWVRHIVDQTNALKPDLIAITGDLVDGGVPELASRVAVLAELKAPLGVYFVTGNHEYYSGVEPWCNYLNGLGLRVLRNERVALRDAQGACFDVAGVDDWYARAYSGHGADLEQALAGRDQERPVVLLAHQPMAVHEAARRGVDLQLSGHTHGGQIWPFGLLVHLQQPYIKGLHRYRDTATQIYVSEGTGFWGPPMRLGTTAEITEITLQAGQAG